MAKRVLICDDSPLMRKMVAETLTQDAWEVVGEASDGAEAFAMYRCCRPDAVTMDIVMPNVDGLTALENIRREDPRARVVVISALSQTKKISEAIRKGASDFVAKPFMPEQLQQTMNGCLA